MKKFNNVNDVINEKIFRKKEDKVIEDIIKDLEYLKEHDNPFIWIIGDNMSKEHYKYIDGTGYFDEEYVLSREREIDNLKLELQQANSVIKEYSTRIIKAIEYIENNCNEYYVNVPHYRGVQFINIDDLLEILDKEK